MSILNFKCENSGDCSKDSSPAGHKKDSFPNILDIKHSGYEIAFYWIAYLCITGKCFYELITFTQRKDTIHDYEYNNFIEPFAFGLYDDKTLEDFLIFYSNGRFLLVSSLLCVGVSRLLRYYTNKWIFSLGSIASTCVFLSFLVSWQIIVFLFAFITLFILFGHFRMHILSWMLAIATFKIMNGDSITAYYADHILDGEDGYFFGCMFAGMSLLCFRGISLSHELSKWKERSLYTYLACYHYSLYQVTFLIGPLSTFNSFYKRLITPETLPDYRIIARRVARLVLWAFVYEVVSKVTLCSTYFESLSYLKGNRWQLFGGLYGCGIQFYLEYVQVYGWAHLLSTLDGYKVADWPCCISRIFLYSEMWRVFDRGLYEILKRHLYVPLGGSQKGLLRKVFSTCLCFLCIYIYHGSRYSHAVWIGMNLVHIICEKLCAFLYSKSAFGVFIRSRFSYQAVRRIAAFAASIGLHVSFLAIIIFFKGTNVGYHMLRTGYNTKGVLGYILISNLFTFSVVQLSITTKPQYERQEEEKRAVKAAKRRLAAATQSEIPAENEEKKDI